MSAHDKIEDSKFDHEGLKKRIIAQYKSAMLDCLSLGYGFIVLKRIRGCNTFDARHASWLEVKDALEDLGAIGPLGGDQAKKKKDV